MAELYSVLNGIDFNRTYPSAEFYKLTNMEELHNDFQFKTGLNIDIHEFNPTGKCTKGGIYFTDKCNLGRWIEYNCKIMFWIRKVMVPNDAVVYIEYNKFKSNMLFLEERVAITTRSDLIKLMIKLNGWALRYLDKQQHTEYIRRMAVRQNGIVLRLIINPTEEVCVLAVNQTPAAWTYVPDNIKSKIYPKYVNKICK